MKNKLIIPFLFITFFSLKAQETFSQKTKPDYSFTMKEAVQYALDSSYTNINARRSILSAIKKKWETTAIGLPHIDANISYSNRLKQPVQLIPSEFIGGTPGTFIPVTFGTKQQLSATATATQLLFDGSYIVGLQAAKTFLEYSRNAAEKTALQTRKSVIGAYGNVLLSTASIIILKKNVVILENNLFETKKIYENGLTDQESVEQLQITLSQVKNRLRNAERMQIITQQLLKLALGIPIEKTLVLEDDLNTLAQENISLSILNEDFEIQKNINYQIAKNLTEQRELELKLEKSKALPTLSTFINYSTRANSNSFSFLETEQKWFQSSIWGVSLNIPIFSSLQRSAKTQQAKIALDQAQTKFRKAKQQIRLQVKTAKSNYVFAIESYRTSQKNLNLARRIADKNQIKFGQGLASSFELRQAQTQLYTAQRELLEAMLNIITAKAELETILNTPEIEIDIN